MKTQRTSSAMTQPRQLKRFDKHVRIEISLDSIAEKLHDMFKDDALHSTEVTNAIITLLDKSNQPTHSMTMLYNAINGHNNDINYDIGEEVMIDLSDYTHELVAMEGSDDKWKEVRKPIGLATIVDIDIYNTSPIKISYHLIDDSGVKKNATRWMQTNNVKRGWMESNDALADLKDKMNRSPKLVGKINLNP